jgi:hypothetical protein
VCCNKKWGGACKEVCFVRDSVVMRFRMTSQKNINMAAGTVPVEIDESRQPVKWCICDRLCWQRLYKKTEKFCTAKITWQRSCVRVELMELHIGKCYGRKSRETFAQYGTRYKAAVFINIWGNCVLVISAEESIKTTQNTLMRGGIHQQFAMLYKNW